jgi:DNA-binding transcriptional regulator YiaG
MRMELGKQVFKMRIELGLSQQGLADQFGLYVKTIRNYEYNRTKIPHEFYADLCKLVREHRKEQKITALNAA